MFLKEDMCEIIDVEKVRTGTISPVEHDGGEGVIPTSKSKEERRLVFKQDLIILPMLALGYFFGYLV
jgi:hypothetical protein